MAYTGTGTEQDPYLVSNLDDFITCVGITGAYVKVIADINALDGNEYPIYQGITFASSVTVYADTLTKIGGFMVKRTSNCFNRSSTTGTITIRNIHFTDILFVPTGNIANIIYGSLANQWEFIESKISIKIEYVSQWVVCAAGANFHQCGLYFDFEGSTAGSTGSVPAPFNINVKFYESIVELNSVPYNYQPTQSAWPNYAEFTVFKISLKKYTNGTGTRIPLIGTGSHDNIFIISQVLADSASNYYSFLLYGLSQLVDSVASENTTISFADTSGRNYLLTTEQIQSEEYLREIGFIP